jgi:transposase
MDARRAADAMKARPVKTDKADAKALAEMLRAGWYSEVFVKSEDSHRMKALLSARDQLVRNKRTFFGQIRGLLRPFGIKVPSRQGTKKFDAAVREVTCQDDILYACVNALLEALASIEMQIAVLDKRVKAMVQASKACWHLTSVPCIGPITALAFAATIEDPERFNRSRDVGAYLGLTPKRYQSGDCLLTTWSGQSPLKSWGLALIRRIGPKKARVAVARKLACLMLRLWKDGTHYSEGGEQLQTA